MWDLIVSVPDPCLSFYFPILYADKRPFGVYTSRHRHDFIVRD